MPQNIIRREEEHLYATQPLGDAGRRLSAALLRLRRAEQAQEAVALRTSGLSPLDQRALRYLIQAGREGRNLSPKDLIGMLGTSSATVTNVVDRLVERECVERVNHPTDRRARYLKATDVAVRLVDGTIGVHHSRLVAAIDRISDEQAEIAAEVLTQITEGLE
ncbi:MarR family winged helix-turn-helix transcriptional regulator [Microbacterium sp. No. 7]|uniref:MarR family winged helix-turn-helix transcriptional regulator n=1 Tax=Microbacterium sp. No. 7 TaxID=1714373 RepID=UPI0006D242DF|nr:MarR family transcriptional regulator [Microbacterium sp. No. 7]ALJ18439.1 MarR family transcriptional regulator [Microbacterium sp. No. 7]